MLGDTEPDMICKPDISTFRVVPWAAEPVAVIIHDCLEWDGSPVALSPRSVLRNIIKLYTERGWRPVVAPEMEFYLVARQQNPHEPLQPPIGRTGKPEAGRQSYSIDAVNDFDPFFMELSKFCDVHRLGVETLIHEAGAGQMEINFTHGDPLKLLTACFCSNVQCVKPPYVTVYLPHLWLNRWRLNQAAPCIFTKALLMIMATIYLAKPMAQLAQNFFITLQVYRMHSASDADVCALCKLLPQARTIYVSPHQRALGLRQPNLRHSRAKL